MSIDSRMVHNKTYQGSRFASNVKSRVNKKLRLLSEFLAAHFDKLTMNTKKSIVIIFSSFVGLLCFMIVVFACEKKSSAIYIETITLPSTFRPQSTNSIAESPLLSIQQITRISRFKKYLDSLRDTEEGRMKYDSINKNHPGLIDSLVTIEKYFK